MNDLAMLDRDYARLADGPGDDPAAILLRSARSDVPDKGSKDRVRAMLGIAESVQGESFSALPLPMEVLRARRQRKQNLRVIEPFIPFQNLTLPARTMSMRKLSGVLVASLQVAAILAALFIRPFPKFESRQESAPTRRQEPEMSLFWAPQDQKNPEVLPSEGLAKNTVKSAPNRAKTAARSNAGRDVSPLHESVVTDEHASSLFESPLPQGLADTASTNDIQKIASSHPPSPVAFSADMTHPVRISGTDPNYPTIARLRNVSGTVVMRCTITVEGLARKCMILKSPAYLDEAMLEASRTWRFTPATEQGRPVSVFYVFKANFQLR